MKRLEKRCFIDGLRPRYRRVCKGKKGEILDMVQESLGVSRRQARRLLEPRANGRPKTPLRAGRPGKYQDAEFKRVLKELWRTMRYMCSRHMKSAIPEWLPSIEQGRGNEFPEHIKERLISISPATIDRILKPYKGLKGKSLTRSGSFRDEIPIQENVWNIEIPGFFEADTVAHCGGSTRGEYINTLMMADIATIWTEARAVFGKGSTQMVYSIEDIEIHLPFDIRGYDSDNGTEVLNQHVLRYFQNERIERGKPPVQITRSREYRKNNQAHVEQRNDSVARKWLGYERLDFKELQPLINCYYKYILCPMLNHFFPVFKLHDKIRIKSRTRRVYKDPITPYQRVMNSSHVADELKMQLKQIHNSLNPVKLSKLERKVRTQIDIAHKALKAGKCSKALLDTSHIPTNTVANFRVSHNDKIPIYKTGT